jgi:hypothetical protein
MTNFNLQWYTGKVKYGFAVAMIDNDYWAAPILKCPCRPERHEVQDRSWETSKYTIDGSSTGLPVNMVICNSYMTKTTGDLQLNNYWSYANRAEPTRWAWRLGAEPDGMLLADGIMYSGLFRNYHHSRITVAYEDGSAGHEGYTRPGGLTTRTNADGFMDVMKKLNKNYANRTWH